MKNVFVGDYVYFIKKDIEYLGEIIGINVEKVITVKYLNQDGVEKVLPIGDSYDVQLTDITGIKQLDTDHKIKETNAYLDENGHWRFKFT